MSRLDTEKPRQVGPISPFACGARELFEGSMSHDVAEHAGARC